MTSKRRYVLPSASPPTTSDSSTAEDHDTAPDSLKKKRKCTRRNKVNYNESNSKPHMRESYVFSTALANLAASAVKHRMCDTIIIYHQGIPREPNRLTIKPPKVASKLLAASSMKSRKRVKEEKRVSNNRISDPKPKTKPINVTNNNEPVQLRCTNETKPSIKSPLTPPRSPKIPSISGDYALSVSERIKCRSRACAPKFYGEAKEEKEEGYEAPEGAMPGPRSKSAEKPRRSSNERSSRRLSRRDSIESDGEKIRSILENSQQEKSLKPAEIKPAEIKPAEIKPADIKPADIKPADDSDSKTDIKSDIKPVKLTSPARPEKPTKPTKSPKISVKSELKVEKTEKTEKPETKVTDKPKEKLDKVETRSENLTNTKPKCPMETKPDIKPETITKVENAIISPKREPPPPQPPKTKPSPKVSPKLSPTKPAAPITKPRLSDSASNSLFEAAMSLNLKSPRGGGAAGGGGGRTKMERLSSTSSEKSDTAECYNTKFKPVKQACSTSPSTEQPPTPTVEDTSSLPKFKPLPISGNPKKNRSFKFRTTGGSKHDMNLVDSIFSNDSSTTTELAPLTTTKSNGTHQATTPPTSTPSTKIPVTKLPDKPPRPELVMGIPNLQGPSKPPMLTPAHNSTLQHVIRTGPPPLSSPKIAVTTKTTPPNHTPSVSVPGNKRLSSECHPPLDRKKKRFVYAEDGTTKTTSPITPTSPKLNNTRISPGSPQPNVDTILHQTPILRNGLPLHKPSPKNSPQNRRTPLEFLADFSERRSPLAVKLKETSPITPKASPSTVGQFYQPNVSLNSCSRNDINLSESVLEHSKLSSQQLNNRSPVVTINHQTISLDHDRTKDAINKPRLSVENEAFSKKQQQEIFARQQLFSRAFSPYHLPNSIPTTTGQKLNKQLELTHQLKQQDLGSLVDLYGRGEKESQPAFPTSHLRQHQASSQLHGRSQSAVSQRSQQPSPRSAQRNIPTELLVQQERERLLSQQQERLLAQQRQHAAASGHTPTSRQSDSHGHGPLFPQQQRQDTHPLLQRQTEGAFPSAPPHLQHLPYSSGVLNHIAYPMLNPQLYKQLANDPALTQVTSASILQSIAGYHQQLQLAAAAGKLGPLAHLYQANSKQSGDSKTPSQFGVIRP